MVTLRRIAPLLFLVLFCVTCPALAQDKVIYHIDDAAEQALRALRNVRNHLDVAPDTKIIVVAHGDGVDFLLEGAQAPKSNVEYGPLVAALKTRGVSFEVCEVTMKRRKLTKDQFVMETEFVPSGVVRIAQLQFQEHFAYIKP